MAGKIKNRVSELKRPSKEFARKYVSEDIDLANWDMVEPLLTELLERKLESVEDIKNWIDDQSELGAAIDEEGSIRYVTMTCFTEDEEIEKAYLHFLENIKPKMKPFIFKLNKKLLDNPHVDELEQDRWGVYLKSIRNSIELFREENIPLQTKLSKMSQKYQKINGAMMVTYEGEEKTMQEMNVYQQVNDRDVRKETFDLMTERRLQDVEELENLFNDMLKLRHQIALNAGFDNFRDFMFQAMERFDYTPKDCVDFHDAVEKLVVPLTKKETEDRRQSLGIDSVRPWDTACDSFGREPLTPFSDIDELVFGCRKIFEKVDSKLGSDFQILIDNGLLDLDSRKGKAPGGYQSTLSELRFPFIFMNAVGLNRDVFTLLHEGGHAFHALAARQEPLIAYRHGPMEFCEVASMAMEHLSLPFLDEFYNEKDAARTVLTHFTGGVGLLPWVAIVDSFQHWIYTNPDHTTEERADKWLEIWNRFGADVDYTGYEDHLKYRWQMQLHIFEVPFYYIEYAIALLGAWQVWKNSLEDPKAAIEAYKYGLSLGGSKTLPELFKAAGIKFDFTEKTIKPLMEKVGEEIERLKKLEK